MQPLTGAKTDLSAKLRTTSEKCQRAISKERTRSERVQAIDHCLLVTGAGSAAERFRFSARINSRACRIGVALRPRSGLKVVPGGATPEFPCPAIGAFA